jgi:anti-anti-sigma regulatory factor
LARALVPAAPEGRVCSPLYQEYGIPQDDAMTSETQDRALLVLHVTGRLDADGVRALADRLDAEDGAREVVLDLGAAREVDHVALAVLAHDLRQRSTPRVVLRGLCEHHIRMLRYFGLDVRAEPPPPSVLVN